MEANMFQTNLIEKIKTENEQKGKTLGMFKTMLTFIPSAVFLHYFTAQPSYKKPFYLGVNLVDKGKNT